MNSREHRDASGRLTFDFGNVPADDYPEVARSIAERFGLEEAGDLVIGLDERFQDYRLGDAVVGIEWDIWSGLSVVATTPGSEGLARRIARFVARRHPKTG